MKKSSTLFLISVVSLIAVIVVSVILYADSLSEKLRPRIIASIQQSTKLPLEVEGISIRLFPAAKIKLSNLSLPSKDPKATLFISDIEATTSLSSLLSGQLNITAIKISEPTFSIVRQKDGQIVIPVANPTAENIVSANNKQPKAKESDSTEPPIVINISSVIVSNGRFDFIDSSKEDTSQITISEIDLTGKNLTSDGKGTLTGALSFLSSAHHNINITGSFDLASFDISKAKAALDINSSSIDAKVLSELLHSLGFLPKDFSLENKFTFQLILKPEGNRHALQTSLDFTDSSISSPSLKKPAGVKLSLIANTYLDSLSTTPLPSQIKIDPCVLSAGSNTLSLSSFIFPNDKVLVIAKSDGINLEALQQIIVKLADYKATGAVVPSLNFSYTLQQQPDISPVSLRGSIDIKNANLLIPFNNGQVEQLSKLNGSLNFTAKDTYNFDLGARYKNYPFKLILDSRYSADQLEIFPSSLLGLGGTINAEGKTTNNELKPFSFALKGSGINLELFSNVFLSSFPVTITGTLTAINATSDGVLSNLAELNNTTTFSASKGSIKGYNIISETLAAATSTPGLSEALVTYVPEKYRPLVTQNATSFETISAAISVKNQLISLNDITLNHQLYTISGSGTAHFDGSFVLDIKLSLTKLLADEMQVKEPKLSLLMDDNHNIVIPVEINRKEGHTIVLPDTKDLIERGAKSLAQDTAKKLLDKKAPAIKDAGKLLKKLF